MHGVPNCLVDNSEIAGIELGIYMYVVPMYTDLEICYPTTSALI